MMPWFPHAQGTDATSRFRRHVAELECPDLNVGLCHKFLAAGLFLVSSARQISLSMRENSAWLERDHGIGRFTQLIDIIYWTIGLNHFAGAYHAQRVGIRRDRRQWRHYIDHREHIVFIDRHKQEWDTRLCTDKKFLFTELYPRGEPVIQVMMAAADGVLERELVGASVPASAFARDLIFKPSGGSMFDGIERWQHLPTTQCYQYYGSEGRTSTNEAYHRPVSLVELEEHFRALSVARPMLLQPWLKSHPDLDALCPHNIANFRFVTSRVGEKVEVISVLLRLGFDTAKLPDTTYQANVDLETGVLGWATSRVGAFGYTENHIETSARVKGLQVRGFDQMKALVSRVHRQFSKLPTIGWDVISTTDGILIMEGNLCWGADINQVGGPLLGETSYPEANLAAVARAETDVRNR